MRASTPLVRPLARPTARPRVPPRQTGASMASPPDAVVTTVDEQWVALAHALADAAAVVTTKYFRRVCGSVFGGENTRQPPPLSDV